MVDPATGTAGFIVAGDDLIIVAFRGTENLLDWRTNMTAEWARLKGGVRVHTGFYGAYSKIRKPMFAAIEQAMGGA